MGGGRDGAARERRRTKQTDRQTDSIAKIKLERSSSFLLLIFTPSCARNAHAHGKMSQMLLFISVVLPSVLLLHFTVLFEAPQTCQVTYFSE